MKHLIMGTAGHIDHGKTSLIKALTGIDCDTHKEEKRRGITINLGFSYLNLPNGESIGIIDVPGHKDFINTMVGGACGIDFVMLVIAADSGIMPQTIEHINIINALGINNGIIALTKADLVDNELIEIAKLEILEFLEKSTLQQAQVVAVSSTTGEGLDELKLAIEKLMPEIEEKKTNDCFRMYIDRLFSVRGFGSVVTGSVMGGMITTEQDVYLLPGNNEKLRVRSIERHGQAVDRAIAGDRAAINLIGIDLRTFRRGMLIANKFLKETNMIDVNISLFDNNETLPLWSQVTFHTGTYESPAKMHNLSTENSSGGKEIIAQLHLTKPAILLNRDRFIIRNSSGDKTLGGGYVIDVTPLHHKKRTKALATNLTTLSQTLVTGGSVSELVGIELKKEFQPFSIEDVADKMHMKTDELVCEIDKGDKSFSIYRSPENTVLIHGDFDKTYTGKVLKILSDYHREFPLFPGGYDANELAGKLNLSKNKIEKIYVGMLLQQMEKDGSIEKHGNTWIVSGHRPVIDKRTKEEIDWLENVISECDSQLPVLTDIEDQATLHKIPKHKLKVYVTYLAQEGRISTFQNEILHASHVGKFRQVLMSMLAGNDNGIPINDFKDKIGATKRFCAALVGIFETEKIIKTKGTGIDTRLFLAAAKPAK